MKRIAIGVCFLTLAAASAGAHDLFLKFDTYFLRPRTRAVVRLLNGSFGRSENAVARDRMRDVSLLTPAGERRHPPASDWRDEGPTSLLSFETAGAGTYVVGLSTLPREISLKAAAFNDYLSHDGVPDTLAERKRNGQLGEDARERYSKHVKAIFQVGETRTENYQTPLGYPVEIIPRQNPYALRPTQTLEVLCLKDGQPLANQFVMAGRESKGRGTPLPGMRTDAQGIARVPLSGPGKWYVKLIQMTPLNEAQLDYESKWATLTFELK